MTKLNDFNSFLSGIDLDEYREQYSKIKLVELDLPREIQALPAIYEQYWDKQENWLLYDDFYEEYKTPIIDSIEQFIVDTRFSRETFELGLPARIYRTWASLITQIQGGYVCGELYGYDNIQMSPELDWQGIDFRIISGNKFADIQVKKQTYSAGGLTGLTREARYNTKKIRGGEVNTVEYEVAPPNRYLKDGSMSKPFTTWTARYDGLLSLLDNGFVIFENGMFAKNRLTFQ